MRNMILQNVSLSSNLKRLRADSGLSQIKVVEQMNLLGSNLDRPSYAKIELGRRNIKVTLTFLSSLKGFSHMNSTA